MAAKIGILGESTVTSTGTTTIYTVDTDKAARVQILYAVEGNGSDNIRYNVFIGTPGTEITIHHNPMTNDDIWTGINHLATPDPANSQLVSVMGIQKATDLNIDDTVNDREGLMGPLPIDYFLNAGDTVRFNINQGVPADHLIQVHGVEDDA